MATRSSIFTQPRHQLYLFRLAYCISLLRTDYVYWQAANTEPTHNMPLLSLQNYRRTLMLLSIGKAF